jgi:hypothetical protein
MLQLHTLGDNDNMNSTSTANCFELDIVRVASNQKEMKTQSKRVV